MNFSDLLSVAQVNEEFSSFATHVFRFKYSHLEIVIRDDFRLPNDPNELFSVAGMQIDSGTIERVNRELSYLPHHSAIETKTQVELENGDQILKTFKHFGHLIKKIKIELWSLTRRKQSELVGHLVNKYSIESLFDIKLARSPDIFLERITKPLINVKNLTFDALCYLRVTSNDNVCFSKLFPAVNRLKLNSLIDDDIAYFDYYMPELKYISMKRSSHDCSSLPGVIMKNPQIQSIDLYSPEPEFLRNLSIFLPQLKSLKLTRFQLSNGSIQFGNVTTLIINAGFFTTPANLHFPQIQSVHIDYSSHHFADYHKFFNGHNQLSQLHLTIYKLDDSFQQLTANLTNLVKVIIKLELNGYVDHNLKSSIFVDFLRCHEKVKQFIVVGLPLHCGTELQKQLKEEWDARINSDEINFQRKINTYHTLV